MASYFVRVIDPETGNVIRSGTLNSREEAERFITEMAEAGETTLTIDEIDPADERAAS